MYAFFFFFLNPGTLTAPARLRQAKTAALLSPQPRLRGQLHESVRGEALFPQVFQIPGELFSVRRRSPGGSEVTCGLGGGLRNVPRLCQSE